MKLLLVVLVGALLLGCTDPKTGCHSDDWTCHYRYDPVGEQRDRCINNKLDHMSDADHTANWSAELVKALHEVCSKLYTQQLEEKKP